MATSRIRSGIRAGELRHRVRIEQRSAAQDAAGGLPDSWDLVAEVWASVEPLVGREFFASAERQGRVSTRFRLRHLDDITPAMRIVWAWRGTSRVYDIEGVQPVTGIAHELVVMAFERTQVTP